MEYTFELCNIKIDINLFRNIKKLQYFEKSHTCGMKELKIFN
jgi:hypothetical protein